MKNLRKITSTIIWLLLFVGAIMTVVLFIYDWVKNPIEVLEKSFEFIKTGLTVLILFVLMVMVAIKLSDSNEKNN